MKFKFVRKPPSTVSDLVKALHMRLSDLHTDGEPAMGYIPAMPPPLGDPPPSEDIAFISIRYRWDMYHQLPVTSTESLAGREVEQYNVIFSRGRADLEKALGKHYGAPTTIEARRRYGPFFVDARDLDRVVLEWYARQPDWAKPQPDESERARAIRDFAQRIAAATTYLEFDAAVAALPPVTGLVWDGRSVKLDPPMAALELAAALGIPDAIGKSVDVHMSSYRLVIPAPPGTKPVRLGIWNVEAALTRHPTGGERKDIRVPASSVAAFGPDDRVYNLYFPLEPVSPLD